MIKKEEAEIFQIMSGKHGEMFFNALLFKYYLI